MTFGRSFGLRVGFIGTGLLTIGLLGSAPPAAADPCEVVDNGTGTITLPPIGCDYLSPNEVHVIIDGLPPGTTIELAPIHRDFICFEQPDVSCTVPLPPGQCEAAGGGLGGNADCFRSTLELQVTGTGALVGFNRVLQLQVFTTEIHTGPRNPGDPVQTFPTEMVQLDAALFGDPDFDLLQIRAGSAFGLPSPGETTLTELPGGNWNVDSFFDIVYEIDFVGAPGSLLEGFGGTTQANLRMQTGEPVETGNPCTVTDPNGTGTVTLPPEGCEYLSPDEVHEIINGLPPGTTIELAAIHKDFLCSDRVECSVLLPPDDCEVPGGSLGGSIDCAESTVELTLTGTGALGGFSRTISIPLQMEVHTGPRTPGDPVQSFPTEMVQMFGQLFGDPDFDTLRITAGSDNGLPSSSGQTTLTRLGPPGSDFQVDSFFDIVYEIDFVGAPGGQLDGLSGSTQGSIRMGTGDPNVPLLDPEPPSGIPTLPTPWLLILVAGVVATGVTAMGLRRRRA